VGQMRLRGAAVAAAALGVALCGPDPSAAADRNTVPGTLKVGVSLSWHALGMTRWECLVPFQVLLGTALGSDVEFSPTWDALQLGERVATGKVPVGLFEGVEFAWAQQKYPDLRPLVLVVNGPRPLQAHLLVRADAGITSAQDLRGKVLAIPLSPLHQGRLFLQHVCPQARPGSAGFFARTIHPLSGEEALDDLADGTVQAAVVDGNVLASYERRKPVRFSRLRVLRSSKPFPPSVIAYRSGVLDQATLRRLREGMLHLHRTPGGQQLLTLCHLTDLQPVPADYESLLAQVARTYPVPAGPSEAVAGAVTGLVNGWRRLGFTPPAGTQPLVATEQNGK
jgi:ABC-type phosphate/phosphonate transport system substrate-binding protein